jgi:ribA/ribD-fused uncharacterized protein
MIKIPYYETSYFAFSNFSPHAIVYGGILYPTAEHVFHAAKFTDEKIKEQIRNAKSPLEAYALGQANKTQRLSNWDEVKVDILYQIVKEKVKQHEDVRNALLATADDEIVEENPNDSFWGNGKDGNGENQMGKILMRIREEIKSNNIL